jgi:hypothetical protein
LESVQIEICPFGSALKLFFMDAHLKVQEKVEIFDDYLQRRLSVIQAYIGQFNTKLPSCALPTGR